jgi:hypothetical protein
VEYLALAVRVVLEEGLRVLPAGERADLERAEVAAEIDGDDVVKVGAGSVAKNSTFLGSISRCVVAVL